MTPDHRSDFPLTLDLLYELLDVAPELPVRRLLQAARQVRGVLAPLVLSLAEREGIAMGTGARDELARMRRRAETYRQLAEDTARVPGARVVKGPSLARHYPEGPCEPWATSMSSCPAKPPCGRYWPSRWTGTTATRWN